MNFIPIFIRLKAPRNLTPNQSVVISNEHSTEREKTTTKKTENNRMSNMSG